MRIIITGGGTGGHIYPALAIASEIKRRNPAAELLYVGTERGLESKIVPPTGISFKTIEIRGIDRTSMLKASRALIKFPFSFFQARDIIKDYKPDIIVGTGGYVSYPVVLAGTFMDIRTVIHEQNAIPGLANRNLSRRVDRVLLTFEEARKYLDAKNIKVTGLPVRTEILAIDRKKAKSENKNSGRFELLAFGGSLGATSINQALLQLVERYRNDNIGITWIAGQAGYEDMKFELARIIDVKSIRCTVNLLPYMYNIEEAMAVADLAVCRAGASTVCELQVLGLPAILVPYPYAAENHQEKNARALVDKNAAFMIIDEFLDGDFLYKKIEELRNMEQKLQEMGHNMKKEAKPNALNDIVDEIFAV
ncbi:MAG: undecaprenyldiphospho-muramoylpentapeptide beta-N-acetylglucosaminyltransferase [Syntrophomonas sp.]|nr:undecaprenyldiphospho-muramoylpentapeptide beta-N-acetylglucosaminyltransferase [Syntrophomonas sp.]